MRQVIDEHDPRMRQALRELQEMIRERYPSAQFGVSMGEDPEGVYLQAVVDIDDPDEVMDLVVDRLLEFEIEQGLPLYIVILQTPARIARLRAEQPCRAFALPPLA